MPKSGHEDLKRGLFFDSILPVAPLGDFTWDEVGLETEDTEIMVKMVPRKVHFTDLLAQRVVLGSPPWEASGREISQVRDPGRSPVSIPIFNPILMYLFFPF